MKYLIGLLVTIVVIIFIIIKLLTGGGGNTQQQQTPTQLSDYADTNTVMRYTVQNPVQSPATHQEVQITVGRSSANLTIYRGYDGDTVLSKTFPMSEESYNAFLRGLMISGDYTNGNTDKSLQDETGYCAVGDTFVYEIVSGTGDVTQHFWSTSCGQKTFHGDVAVVQQLFESQIPGYDTLTENVQL